MMSFSPSTPTPLTSKQAKRISFDSFASPLFSPSAAARYAQQNEQWNQVSIPFLQIALSLEPHHLIIYRFVWRDSLSISGCVCENCDLYFNRNLTCRSINGFPESSSQIVLHHSKKQKKY